MRGPNQLHPLQTQIIAYTYWAVASRQPKMVTIISGTGMIPQAGW